MPSEMKRLKMLDEENARLKRLVADLSLDKTMLQDVIKRKLWGLPVVENWSMSSARFWGVSIRRACGVLQAHRSTYHYKAHGDEQAEFRKRIKELAETRVRYGYRRIHVLLQREGWPLSAD